MKRAKLGFMVNQGFIDEKMWKKVSPLAHMAESHNHLPNASQNVPIIMYD